MTNCDMDLMCICHMSDYLHLFFLCGFRKYILSGV